jgi:uncharacterized protein
MQIRREISPSLKRAAGQFPAVVLTGPRQAGKTTLLRQLFPEHTYVSLDSLAEQAERDPTRFLAENPSPLLIDEVQYAPGLCRHLKVAIDRERHRMGRFILTGSQKLPLMRGVSDSLAGRAGLFELEPLSLAELRAYGTDGDSDIVATVTRGLYPELWRQPALRAREFYASYVATYLERDVRQLLHVVSLRDFERFLRIVSARSGQLLNKSELAKDVGVSTKAIGDWLSVLQASNQVVLLEPYFQNIAKRSVKSPKVFLGDPGLLCFLLNLDATTLPGSPYLGAVWETALFAELRKTIAARGSAATLFYYRDQRAREVDFVLDGGGELTFVEAKWTEHPTEQDARTIHALDDELRDSALRVRSGRHAVLCRAPNAFPIDERVLALPYARLGELLPT